MTMIESADSQRVFADGATNFDQSQPSNGDTPSILYLKVNLVHELQPALRWTCCSKKPDPENDISSQP